MRKGISVQEHIDPVTQKSLIIQIFFYSSPAPAELGAEP